jgi:uncharacterized protein
MVGNGMHIYCGQERACGVVANRGQRAATAELALPTDGPPASAKPNRIMTTIQVKVKPNARVSTLEQAGGGQWLAQLKSPPVDGKANKELVTLIARHFGRPKSAVWIKSGASGRTKLVKIANS